MRLLDILLLTLVQLIWGGNYALQKDAIAAFPPILLVALAYVVIGLTLSLFTRQTHTSQRKLALLAFLSCTLPTSLTFYGVAHAPVTLGSLLMQLQVPFGVVVAWCLGRGQPNSRSIAGIAVTLAGAAVVIGVPNFGGEVWGGVFIVAGTCIWAASQAVLPLVTRDEGLRLYAGLSRHATPQVIIVSLIFESNQLDSIRNAPALAWGELLFGALIAASLCFSIWYKVLMRVPADRILPFLLLQPAAAVLGGWLWLGEPLSAGLLAGGAIIVAGLSIILWPGKPGASAMPVARVEAAVPPEI